MVAMGAVVLAACTSGSGDADSDAETAGDPGDSAATTPTTAAERAPVFRYPVAPAAPDPDVADSPDARTAIERLGVLLQAAEIDADALDALVEAGDARHAWFVADLLRFFGPDGSGPELVDAFESLTGVSLADDPDSERSVWLSATNHLIAWDTPAYPEYPTDKALLFPTPRSSPRTVASVAAIRSTHCRVATTTGRSSRSVRPTIASTSRNSWWA